MSRYRVIIDEFTYLPVSRQRKQQLRMRRDDPLRYREIQRRANGTPTQKRAATRWYRKNRELVAQRATQGRIKKLLGEV